MGRKFKAVLKEKLKLLVKIFSILSILYFFHFRCIAKLPLKQPSTPSIQGNAAVGQRLVSMNKVSGNVEN